MKLTPKNWSDFQQYSDRRPPWIKLHRQILDDYDFACLPLASKALAPLLWLLASEYEGGVIDATLDKLAFRLRMTPGELSEALNPLIEGKFFSVDEDASNALAERKQGACLETEVEKEKESCRAPRFDTKKFEEFWKEYPKRKGDNPKNPARKQFETAVRQGADPNAIISGVKSAKSRNSDKIGTEFIPQAVKWLRDRRWEDYADIPEVPSGPITPNEFAVRMFKQTGRWNNAYGPEPGKPGCRASPEDLAKYGYQSEAAA